MKISSLLGILILSTTLFGQYTPHRIGEKWGLSNFRGELIIEPIYDKVGFFRYDERTMSHRAKIKLDGLYGYLDLQGIEIIKPIYEAASDFQNGYAKVRKDSVSFVIDFNNIIVHDSLYKPQIYKPSYSSIDKPLKEKFLVDKSSWKDNNVLQICIDLDCDKVYSVAASEKFIVEHNKKWGIIQDNQIWVPIEYDSISTCVGENFILYRNGGIGLSVSYDSNSSQFISSCEYDEVKVTVLGNFPYFLFWYRKNDRWGFVQRRMDRAEFMEPQYQTLQICKENERYYEVTTMEGKVGYLHIMNGIEFFSEKRLEYEIDARSVFFEAEAYANSYLDELLGNSNLDRLVDQMEDCMSSGHAEADSKQIMYRLFWLNIGGAASKIDTSCLLNSGAIFEELGIINDAAINISPVLIMACRHLAETYGELIERHPDYVFSNIIKAFQMEIVNQLSPHLMYTALDGVFQKCDFEKAFYQKVVLLSKYYHLVYMINEE